jgi:hypothetical protein
MRYLIYLTFIVSTSLSAGEIHKWVDEDGNVHYTDAPPVSAKTETVRVQSAPSNPGKALPRLSTQGDSGGDSDTGEDSVTNPEVAKEQARSTCERARSDLEIINSSSSIKFNFGDGTTRDMTSDEIAERRQRSEDDIDKYCN